MSWQKEFDKKFKGATLIWYEAFVKDAKKYGFKPIVNYDEFREIPIGKNMIKEFISNLLTKQRQKIAKALRMKEWKAEVIGNVTDHVNILIRKQNQRLDSYLKKQEGK